MPRPSVSGRHVRTTQTVRRILGSGAVGAAGGLRRPRVSVSADPGARHSALQTGPERTGRHARRGGDGRDVPMCQEDSPTARLPAV